MKKTKNKILDKCGVILATLETGKDITDITYRQYVKDKNRNAIADMIFSRLYGRYLKLFNFKDKIFTKEYKSGFSIMANCCLCIEALQSFKNGWGETPKGKGDKTFEDFFIKNDELKSFGKQHFYGNIRCGILHQGETKKGWRILRSGKLLDNKAINSVKFLDHIKKAVGRYVKELKESEWNSNIWNNCRTKMCQISKNCYLL